MGTCIVNMKRSEHEKPRFSEFNGFPADALDPDAGMDSKVWATIIGQYRML